MSDSVVYDVSEGVATITLNRADAMNALDTPTKVALRDTILAAAEDDAVRCVVLTGTGRAFCVGQDLKEHIGLLQANDTETLWATVPEHFAPIALAIAEMPKPVIASLNGVAAGACRVDRLRLRLPDRVGHGRLQPCLHRDRAVMRHGDLVDAPPPDRTGEGAGVAVLPAYGACRGSVDARPGDERRTC